MYTIAIKRAKDLKYLSKSKRKEIKDPVASLSFAIPVRTHGLREGLCFRYLMEKYFYFESEAECFYSEVEG